MPAKNHDVGTVRHSPIERSYTVHSWSSLQKNSSPLPIVTLQFDGVFLVTRTILVGSPSGPNTSSPTLSSPCVRHPPGVSIGVSSASCLAWRGGMKTASRRILRWSSSRSFSLISWMWRGLWYFPRLVSIAIPRGLCVASYRRILCASCLVHWRRELTVVDGIGL